MSLFNEIQEMQDVDLTDDFEPPSYNEPGRILFRYCPDDPDYTFDVEIIDLDGSAFWLQEGGFCDSAVQGMVQLELEGYYVLEGITGHAWRDYFGEYDEEWSFEFCRRADQSEIDGQCLNS